MAITSETLAKEIKAGTLILSKLEGCVPNKLPINLNPLIINFNQLFLIKKNLCDKSPFLGFPPYCDFFFLSDVERVKMSKKIADGILASIQTNKDIKSGLLSDPKKDDKIEEKEYILRQRKIINSHQNFSPKQLLLKYKNYVDQQIETEAKQIHKIYSSVLEIPLSSFIQRDKLADEILEKLLDPYYAHHLSKTRYRVAIYTIFQQEWKHVGYTRGDLIKSLSLSPGETVTLEYHYWDKSIIKSEQELSNEFESKLSSSLTKRDSKDVLDELTKNNQLKLDANSNLSIPLPPANLVTGVAGGISSQMTPHISNSISNSIENVVSVSNNFKQIRKVRIEETRDNGKESKQTRIVANTNRCHILEFNYFEVLSNYIITSKYVGLKPCLLLPFIVECDRKIFSCKKITSKFILCNEHILKNVLIDSKFLAGFDAAKQIESFSKLKKLFSEHIASSIATAVSTSPTIVTSEDAIENEYLKFRDDILKSYEGIIKAGEEINTAFEDFSILDGIGGFVNIANSIVSYLRILPAWISIQINSDALNALENLKAAKASNRSARKSMRDFFAVVDENDFQFLFPIQSDFATALEGFGLPSALSDFAAILLLSSGLITAPVQFIRDDKGLHTAVQTAESFFDTNDRSPTGQVTTPITTGESPASISPPSPVLSDFVSLPAIADAYVELDRLICHIECNCEYYKQALWLSKGPDYRSEFLKKAGVSQFVTNEVVGFYGNYAAFPIIDHSFTENVIDKNTFEKNLENDLIIKEISDLITLPTPSTTMRGILDNCDLCEEYIEQSRIADVRQQNAKAELDEAEAALKLANAEVTRQESFRMADRLNAFDLSDPTDRTTTKVDVTVNNSDV